MEREMAIPKGDRAAPVPPGRRERASFPRSPGWCRRRSFSDHPGSAWYGAWYVAETLDILTQNPEVWKKTIFVLTYDENDGYFDHVPPFVAPRPGESGIGQDVAGDRCGRGVSAPGAGPEESPGEGSARRTGGPGLPRAAGDRLAVEPRRLRLLAGVRPHLGAAIPGERDQPADRESRSGRRNISAWRRTVCGDLSAAFRPFQGGAAGGALSAARDAFFEQVHQAQFSPCRRATGSWARRTRRNGRQRRAGRRGCRSRNRACDLSAALPYELAAGGRSVPTPERFEIVLEAGNAVFGSRAAGAPFHVYTPGKFRGRVDLRTRAYAVSAGQRLTDSWDLRGFEQGNYHLRVCGPNGFLREFAGSAEDPRVEIDIAPVVKAGAYTGDVELRIASRAKQALTLLVKDHGYKSGDHSIAVEPGAVRTLQMALSGSHRWYDFSVTAAAAAGFLRRFAGRVETGESGYSDPVMGRAV